MFVPAVTVKDLGVTGRKLENRTLQLDTLIFPVQTILSMGPAETISSRTSLLPSLCLARHHRHPPVLDSADEVACWSFRWVYADNFGAVAPRQTNLGTVGVANSKRLVSQYTRLRRQPMRLRPWHRGSLSLEPRIDALGRFVKRHVPP